MRGAAPMLALIAAVAVGCGDDSDDAAEPAPMGDDAAEFRRELNRLCRQDTRTGERLARGITGPDDLVPYFERAITLARKRRPLYEALRPPSDLRDEHRRSLEAGRRLERLFDEVVRRAGAGGDPAEELQRVLPRMLDGVEENNRLARRMGVRDCVVESPAPGAAPQAQTF